jgi:hypothetical protein
VPNLEKAGRQGASRQASRQRQSLFAFTFAPWLLSDPSGPIWFADGIPPEHPSLIPTEHRGLKRLDQLASPDAGPLARSTNLL